MDKHGKCRSAQTSTPSRTRRSSSPIGNRLGLAEQYLSKLVDPFELSLLMAEPDDEPLTEDDLRLFAAAEERQRRGEPGIPTSKSFAS